jgi:hypothetical protein
MTYFSAVIKILRVHCYLILSCMTETLINKELLTLTYALDQPDEALCSRRYTTLPSCVRRCVEHRSTPGGARRIARRRHAPIALKRGACTSRERACRVRAALVCRRGEPPGRRPNAVPIANMLLIYYSCTTMCDTNNNNMASHISIIIGIIMIIISLKT